MKFIIGLMFFVLVGQSFAWSDEGLFLEERNYVIKSLENKPGLEIVVSEKLKIYLLDALRSTPTGQHIAREIERLSTTGFEQLNHRKLKLIWMAHRQEAPLAEYTNDGVISLNARLVLGVPNGQIHPSKKMIESFLVHEMTHAIVHDLYSRNLLPFYGPSTKLNELLAYKVQGQYIEELERQGVVYDERVGTPIWDLKTMAMVGELKDIGIEESTAYEEAQNKLSDLMLEAESDQEMARALSLQRYFDFITASGEKARLWSLTENNSVKVQSSLYLYGFIKQDLEDQHFSHFFTYLKNRIPLYADYADSPEGINTDEEIASYIQLLSVYLRNR